MYSFKATVVTQRNSGTWQARFGYALPPAHTKGVCPPYSGPSGRTLAKRRAKSNPRRGPGNCGRKRS